MLEQLGAARGAPAQARLDGASEEVEEPRRNSRASRTSSSKTSSSSSTPPPVPPRGGGPPRPALDGGVGCRLERRDREAACESKSPTAPPRLSTLASLRFDASARARSLHVKLVSLVAEAVAGGPAAEAVARELELARRRAKLRLRRRRSGLVEEGGGERASSAALGDAAAGRRLRRLRRVVEGATACRALLRAARADDRKLREALPPATVECVRRRDGVPLGDAAADYGEWPSAARRGLRAFDQPLETHLHDRRRRDARLGSSESRNVSCSAVAEESAPPRPPPTAVRRARRAACGA